MDENIRTRTILWKNDGKYKEWWMFRMEITLIRRKSHVWYWAYFLFILQKIGIIEQTIEIEKICLNDPMQLVERNGKPVIFTSEKVLDVTKNKYGIARIVITIILK